jgi:hypothetical protein
MKALRHAVLAAWFGLGAVAMAEQPSGSETPAGAVKPNPARNQNVVPITEFMAPPEFPFAPKPKPSLWKRMWFAMKRPFTKEPEAMELPPGTVPMPGVLPTVGPKPAAKPQK